MAKPEALDDAAGVAGIVAKEGSAVRGNHVHIETVNASATGPVFIDCISEGNGGFGLSIPEGAPATFIRQKNIGNALGGVEIRPAKKVARDD